MSREQVQAECACGLRFSQEPPYFKEGRAKDFANDVLAFRCILVCIYTGCIGCTGTCIRKKHETLVILTIAMCFLFFSPRALSERVQVERSPGASQAGESGVLRRKARSVRTDRARRSGGGCGVPWIKPKEVGSPGSPGTSTTKEKERGRGRGRQKVVGFFLSFCCGSGLS